MADKNGGNTGRDKATGRFLPGNPGNKTGGRPKKDDWLKGKGVEALKFAYGVMLDEDTALATRLAAAKMLVEYDLGKPRQAVEATVETKNADDLSLAEKMAYIKQLKAGEDLADHSRR